MAVHVSCDACQGAGSFQCTTCGCSRCNATGNVQETCPKCHSTTKVTCEQCQGQGRILVKKGFFSDKYSQCWKCNGSCQQECSCRTGNVTVSCPSCKGGRYPQCQRCGSTGRLKCTACNGSGKVPSPWLRSLANLSVEKLRFEIDKRQRRLSAERAEISQLKRDYDRREEDWEEDYAAAQSSRYMSENFDSTYYQKGMDTLQSQIDDYRQSVRELQSEIAA